MVQQEKAKELKEAKGKLKALEDKLELAKSSGGGIEDLHIEVSSTQTSVEQLERQINISAKRRNESRQKRASIQSELATKEAMYKKEVRSREGGE